MKSAMAISLTLAAVLSLSACGGGGDTDAADQTPAAAGSGASSGSEATTTPASAEAPAATPATSAVVPSATASLSDLLAAAAASTAPACPTLTAAEVQARGVTIEPDQLRSEFGVGVSNESATCGPQSLLCEVNGPSVARVLIQGSPDSFYDIPAGQRAVVGPLYGSASCKMSPAT